MDFPAVAIISVYFGNLPNYFQLWLDSCSYNEKFNWLVFTDDDVSRFVSPENVHFRAMTLNGFREKMSDALRVEIKIESPYKVCDFRPVFWALLADESQRYQFWGHCDVDMIFGDLGRFITKELLTRYDKLFSVGHFTLYRNCPLANKMFCQPHPRIDWRAIVSDPRHRGFDEHIGVNRIWRANGGRMFENESLIADIDPAITRFERCAPRKNYRNQLFYFDRGHLYRGHAEGTQWRTEEFMYIHFQKRAMKFLPRHRIDRYAIAPGGFFPLSTCVLSNAVADALNPSAFRWREALHRWRCGLRYCRRALGVSRLAPPLT